MQYHFHLLIPRDWTRGAEPCNPLLSLLASNDTDDLSGLCMRFHVHFADFIH